MISAHYEQTFIANVVPFMMISGKEEQQLHLLRDLQEITTNRRAHQVSSQMTRVERSLLAFGF